MAGTSTFRETPAFNGSGNILRVTFKVTKIGNGKLHLETALADKPPVGGVASPIPHTVSDGFFGPIHIFPSLPEIVIAGEEVNISGFIVPAEQNVEIRIEYRRQGETNWSPLSNVTTNQQGNYFYIWQPQEEGAYEIKTKAVFDDTEETSNLFLITVKAATVKTPVLPYADAFLVAVIIGAVVAITVVVYYKKR